MNVAVQESDAEIYLPTFGYKKKLPNRFHKVTWLLALKSKIRLTCLKSVFEANQQQQPGCKFARVLSFLEDVKFTSVRFNQGLLYQCCLTSTETVQTIGDREHRTATSTLTQLLSSETMLPNSS